MLRKNFNKLSGGQNYGVVAKPGCQTHALDVFFLLSGEDELPIGTSCKNTTCEAVSSSGSEGVV